jgi:hypothetical protein
MMPSTWVVAAASVRGRGHEQTGAPCQDSSTILLSPNGKWVALVASDGAGTAKFSDQGSKLVVDEIAKCLIRLSEDCDRRMPGAWVSDRVIRDIVSVRERLRDLAGSDNISDYHCTLSAALLGPSGGLTIHLGDGAIFGGAAGTNRGEVIDLANDHFVSVPQNGEYANETVFLTERDWVKNIRIHPLSAVDWVMLGTDGGMALAMLGESQPKSGFVVPVIRAVLKESDLESRCKALVRILDDRQADRLTNDDKTLIVAIRSQFRDVLGEFGNGPALAPAASSSAPKQGPIASHQVAHGASPSEGAGIAPSHGHRVAQQRNPNQAQGLKTGRLIIWTVVVLTVSVMLAVCGWLVYGALNKGSRPFAAQAPRSGPSAPEEVSKGVDKKIHAVPDNSANASVAPSSASTATLPGPEIEKTAGPTAVSQSPTRAEASKSQK